MKNNETTPTVPYGSSPHRAQHDTIYTVLLTVLAFMSVVSVVTIYWVSWLPTTVPESASSLRLVGAVNLCFLFFEVVVLLIRIGLPERGRAVTMALNIVLLFAFPLGTALAIYGLWKVDKANPGN